jgi:small subunit ribosomal protein S8
MIDPIADMLTRIRNAQKAKHESVKMPSSKLKEKIAGVLKESGYVSDVEVIPGKVFNELSISLKYDHKGVPAIEHISRVSTCGRRVYTGYDKIPTVRSGLGICILTTSKGVMTDKEARNQRVGGEVLCYVW